MKNFFTTVIGRNPGLKSFINTTSKLEGAAPMMALPLLTAFFQPPHERAKAFGEGVINWWMTSAFLSPGKQMVYGTLYGLSGSFSSITRAVVSGHRSSVEQRTMAAIPFSYTSVNMDQAMVTLSNVRERMAGLSYGSKSRVAEQMKIGAEAQLYSARYLSK